MRSSDDFPAPFRPATIRLWPLATEKLIPPKTSRPPRRQARSKAESRIDVSKQSSNFEHHIGHSFVELEQILKTPYKPDDG